MRVRVEIMIRSYSQPYSRATRILVDLAGLHRTKFPVIPHKFNRLLDYAGLRRTSTWWAHQDSNLEPKDYESSALTIELWARCEGQL